MYSTNGVGGIGYFKILNELLKIKGIMSGGGKICGWREKSREQKSSRTCAWGNPEDASSGSPPLLHPSPPQCPQTPQSREILFPTSKNIHCPFSTQFLNFTFFFFLFPQVFRSPFPTKYSMGLVFSSRSSVSRNGGLCFSLSLSLAVLVPLVSASWNLICRCFWSRPQACARTGDWFWVVWTREDPFWSQVSFLLSETVSGMVFPISGKRFMFLAASVNGIFPMGVTFSWKMLKFSQQGKI